MIARIFAVFVCSAAVASAFALDFSIGKQPKSGEELFRPAILLEGEIREGDAAKFVAFLKEHRQLVSRELLPIVPNSPGGSVSEAKKIAEVIENAMLSIWLPPALNFPDRSKQARCASSCFLLVVRASSRLLANQTVGLHRPYFDQSVYSSNPTRQVVDAHERLLLEVRGWLHVRGVPSRLVENMMLRSSREIYWMSDEDIESLGRFRPAVEELMIAKCSFDKSLRERWTEAALRREPSATSLAKKLDEQSQCIESVRRAALLAFLNS